MPRKFEMLFEGRTNQGLRKLIRETAARHDTPIERANAIRGLARTVALSYSGRKTLESVAIDYETLGAK